MPRKATELTDMKVRNLREPGVYAVGGVPGLTLQVLPTRRGDDGKETQARTWLLRATIAGKRREMGLGGYPEVGLKEAREAARKARDRIREGADPIAERRLAKSALLATGATVKTFRQVAEDYIRAHEASWQNPKHRQQWANTLKTYAYPKIGALAVADVDVPQVLDVLKQPVPSGGEKRPLWEAVPETASRLRGRIEAVLDYAKVMKLRTGDNPASWRGNLKLALPARRKVRGVEHHAALKVGEVGAFMTKLRAAEGMGARALEFAILTAARSGEVRGATWAEIDLKEKTWVIPAERTKAKKEHRVPLSAAAVDLLEALPRIGGSPHVFAAALGGQLSDMTLSAVLRRMKVEAVPHGFRSTFKDWASERTAYPNEMSEMALAHTVGNKVEAAYRRGDMFEKRRRMMDDWSTFLTRPTASADVRSIGEGRR